MYSNLVAGIQQWAEVPWTMKGARHATCACFALPSQVVRCAHPDNLELVEKRGHKFCTILYTLHYEICSYSYKSILLPLRVPEYATPKYATLAKGLFRVKCS